MISAGSSDRDASFSTPLPPDASFSSGGQDAAEFDELVVEERHAGLQAPRHRHRVDALHRVVHQHDLGVQPQRGVQCRVGARTGLMVGDELAAGVDIEAVLGGEDRHHVEWVRSKNTLA